MKLFIFITMCCGTVSIMQNILSFMLDVGVIPQNVVSPTKHCYAFE